ncbi:MAG: hypothetical protein KIS92_13555 [Planctomycetota bacterium]|nr:hypothetical protein [Planctomycetota bacterium]
MAKSKEKKKFVSLEMVPTAKAHQEIVKERKDKLAKAKATVTKDGKTDRQSPKYRQALKRLKRAQRKLFKQRVRFTRPGVPLTPPAPAAAPAAAAPAEGEKKE